MDRLWYRRPALAWEEALPLGNGRLGAMIYGGAEKELIQVNEESIWYGGPVNRRNPDARQFLPQVRQMLREGKTAEAEKLMDVVFSGCPDSMHPYQTLGEIQFYFEGIGEKPLDAVGRFKRVVMPEGVENYERSLSLENAVCDVRFQSRATEYTRQFFISKPADCLLMRFCAKGQETLHFYVKIARKKSMTALKNLVKTVLCCMGNQETEEMNLPWHFAPAQMKEM